MDQWYYAKGGQQHGPIGLEAMRGLIENGTIDPAKDLVWNPSMTDWLTAVQVPVLVGGVVNPGTPSLEPTQPFAYPLASGSMEEIVPGSEPIIATTCVKRGWDLVVRHIGPMVAMAAIFGGVWFAVTILFSIIGSLMGVGTSSYSATAGSSGYSTTSSAVEGSQAGLMVGFQLASNIISALINLFLTLGMKRICLNAVSGKQVSVGMLFGQGRLLLRAFGGGILYVLMVTIGTLLFIFPGIYLALRYGQFLTAMVDKNLGVMDSFSYSAKITHNNLVNLFVIYLFSILLGFAGCLALGVGLLFAYPVIWLMWIVAYRWMQYGGRAVLDDPATGQPLLSAAPE